VHVQTHRYMLTQLLRDHKKIDKQSRRGIRKSETWLYASILSRIGIGHVPNARDEERERERGGSEKKWERTTRDLLFAHLFARSLALTATNNKISTDL
jgi:hypothetical protein